MPCCTTQLPGWTHENHSLDTPGAAPARRSGNYGLGTYLGLAGALLAMIVLFSLLSSHFSPMPPSAPWPTRSPT
jgi:hypothetical protein